MRMMCGWQPLVVTAAALLTGAGSVRAAQPLTEITLPGTRLFTESISSTKDGTLYVGSLGKGYVSRIPYRSTDVSVFIQPGVNGLHAVFGVYADEPHRTLWVCSDKMPDGSGEAAVKTFDLKTGAAKGSYVLPGDGFCNDTAVAGDGTAYVADTKQATIWMLRPGATALEAAAKDDLLAGADGLAFGRKRVLYVNSVQTGKMLRVDLGKDGKSTKVTDLKVSQPLTRPDGMRAIGKDRLLLAENSGNMDIVTFSGAGAAETAQIRTIKSGLDATPAVTATRGTAWIAEGKLNLRGDETKNAGVFKIFGVSLPK